MKKRLFLSVLLVLLAVALTACGGKRDENSEVKTTSSILETKENMGDDVLYYIPNENVEAGFTQSLALFQEDFLLYGFREESREFKMQIISRETGEVLAQTAFPDISAHATRRICVLRYIPMWHSASPPVSCSQYSAQP